MCDTCIYANKQALSSKYRCNCQQSEYYDMQMKRDGICDHYKAKEDGSCAFLRDGICQALSFKRCNGCRFRKTRTQLDEERRKSKERIRRLSEIDRLAIVDKYGTKL